MLGKTKSLQLLESSKQETGEPATVIPKLGVA